MGNSYVPYTASGVPYAANRVLILYILYFS
jgi:hypothetical protein